MKYIHKKTGNVYRHLAVAVDATNARENLPVEQRLMVVYCPDDDEHTIYVRDQAEFEDGRFEVLP